MISFNEIKRIKVNKKFYDITLILIETGSGKWYYAYVYLDRKDKNDLDNCTYNHGNVYGIDTMHYFNTNQTIEQKKDDAIRQIKELIKSELKLGENNVSNTH